MNQNSFLCRFISENENWRELLAGKNISIKENNGHAIMNYGIECDFNLDFSEHLDEIMENCNKE